MTVAHVINNMAVGGAERFLVLLADAQRRMGLRVEVLGLVLPDPLASELEARHVAYECLGRSRLNDPRLAVDLWRTLHRLRPDVVHTHLFYADVFGRVAARAAGVGAIVGTEHSTERGGLSRRRQLAMRWTDPFAHRIVAVSEAVRSTVATRIGSPDVPVIPNGIENEIWEDAEPLPGAMLGVDGDSVVVGCVGRLIESKGYALLLEAIARIDQPKLRLVMVGEGPQRAELEARARELGLQSKVRWLGLRHDVPQILKAIHVFVMPSFFEGHSMSLLEAMASGRACLVSDLPELATTLGDSGVRVPVGRSDALADALRGLLADPELRLDLGRRARESARRFSIQKSAAQYVALYDELVQSKRDAPR